VLNSEKAAAGVLDVFSDVHSAGQTIVMIMHETKDTERDNRFLKLTMMLVNLT